MSRLHPVFLVAAVTGFASLAACDYSGDFLFPQPSELVPGIIDLGELQPDPFETLEDIRANARYGELGATGTADVGGMSFNFKGTGRDVCVFVDPETVSWSQSVSRQQAIAGFTWPDNLLDDGDLDLFAGVSVYYSGSPGVEIGGFEVRYQDSLGNEIPVEFNECTIIAANNFPNGGAHAGRAMPEYCTLESTQTGVDYTVVLENFSGPADDNRLGYGLLFLDGSCAEVETIINQELLNSPECLLLGESINPQNNHDYRENPFIAFGSEISTYSWAGSTDVEQLFCSVYAQQSSTELRKLCEEEDDRLPSRADCNREDVRCYCGDIEASPNGDSY